MKKFVSVVLSITMLLSLNLISAYANSTDLIMLTSAEVSTIRNGSLEVTDDGVFTFKVNSEQPSTRNSSEVMHVQEVLNIIPVTPGAEQEIEYLINAIRNNRATGQTTHLEGSIIVSLRIDWSTRNNGNEARITRVSGSWNNGSNSTMLDQRLDVIFSGPGPNGWAGGEIRNSRVGTLRNWNQPLPDWGWIFFNNQSIMSAFLDISYFRGTSQGGTEHTTILSNRILR